MELKKRRKGRKKKSTSEGLPGAEVSDGEVPASEDGARGEVRVEVLGKGRELLLVSEVAELLGGDEVEETVDLGGGDGVTPVEGGAEGGVTHAGNEAAGVDTLELPGQMRGTGELRGGHATNAQTQKRTHSLDREREKERRKKKKTDSLVAVMLRTFSPLGRPTDLSLPATKTPGCSVGLFSMTANVARGGLLRS